jgi:hypothetical protein
MDEFGKTVKDKYDAIEKQEAAARQKLEALAAEKAPLSAYLIKAGIIKAKSRAKRKAVAASTATA